MARVYGGLWPALGTAAASVLVATGAAAQQRQFNIPAEAANKAIPEFARQAGLQIVAPGDALKDVRTAALVGQYDVRVALQRLLTGAGLVVAADTGSVITLRSAGPPPVKADADTAPISEVVVTATKRAENIQDVPQAIVALGENDLKARGASTIEQAIGFVPGVNFSSNGTNAGSYSIRGVATSSSVSNAQATVGLYIDDINILDPTYPKIATNLRLFDVERVEVLEGPQGTLFGSGALGGAIRIITNKPNLARYQAETEDTVSGTDGGGVNYDINAMVNIPLVQDKLALRVVGYYQKDDGYIDNTARQEANANYALSEGARVELKWAPITDLTVLGSALFEDDRPHDSPYSYYGSHDYQWNGAVPNTNYNNTRIYSLSETYNLHWADLISITTFADRYENVQADFTPVAAALLGVASPSSVNDEGPSRTFSQEVRLTSSDTGRLRWLIGAILDDNRRTVTEPVVVPGSGALFGSSSDVVSYAVSHYRIREAAAFGEISYDVLPRLTATVGLRVFSDQLSNLQTLAGTIQTPSQSFTHTDESSATPKFNLSYHLTPASLIYAQVAEGYRVGQSNLLNADPVSHQPIPAASNPDKLWNYELGEKSSFFDGRLVFDADVYFIDWSNIQLGEHTLVSGINYIGNAGEAHVKGLELQLRARPTSSWELGASLSLNDTRLESVSSTVAATQGDRLPGSAPQNVVLYAQYSHPLAVDMDWFARLDGRYVGKEYSDLDNTSSLTFGQYSSLNLRAGIDFRRYTVTGFIENLTDSSGKTSAFPSLTVPVAIRQRPITFGLTLSAKM